MNKEQAIKRADNLSRYGEEKPYYVLLCLKSGEYYVKSVDDMEAFSDEKYHVVYDTWDNYE